MLYVCLSVNTKQKTYNGYTQGKEEKIKVHHYRKSSSHTGRKQDRKKGTTRQPENNKMALASPYLSIITLNVNVSNSPIKRHRVAKWIKITEPSDMLPTRDSHQL